MTDRKKKPVLVQFQNEHTDNPMVWEDVTIKQTSTSAAEKWLQVNAAEGYTYRIVTVERDNLTLIVETKRRLTNG